MLKRINALPTSLKVVAWLNLVLGLLGAIQTVAALTQVPVTDSIVNGLNVVSCLLVVLGILERSRFIRMLTLILSWLAIVTMGLGAVAALFTLGLPALVILIPVIISGVTIWGLTTADAKIHFSLLPVTNSEPPPVPETSTDKRV